MDKLTTQKAASFTPVECVKYFRPEWTNKECFFYLYQIHSHTYNKAELINILNERLAN